MPRRTVKGGLGIAAVAFAGLIAFVLNLAAVKYAGAATTAMMLNLEPVVIFLMAAVVLSEAISADRITGLVLVVVALVLSQWPRRRLA